MKICYLDFDRTIQELSYPETDIQFINQHCIEFVKLIKNKGYKVILNTYRADLNDGSLEQALKFLDSKIDLDEIVKNKIPPKPFIIENDILFIDDESIGIPLKLSAKILGVKVVDFSKIIKLLKSKYYKNNQF
jgi:hypothetical protein